MSDEIILSERGKQVRAYLHVREAALALEVALADLEHIGCEGSNSPIWNPHKPQGKVNDHLDALLDYINERIKALGEAL